MGAKTGTTTPTTFSNIYRNADYEVSEASEDGETNDSHHSPRITALQRARAEDDDHYDGRIDHTRIAEPTTTSTS